MAIVTNTLTTFDVDNIPEDLEDIIYNVAPEETVYLSLIGRTKVKQRFHEWQTDTNYTPSTTNAVIEGDDITTYQAVTPTVRIGVHVQLSHETLIESDTNELVDHAGMASNLAYDIAHFGLKLRQSLESMALNNIADSAGTSSSPRITPGMLAYIVTNTDSAAGAGTGDTNAPSYTSTPNSTRTDDTQRTFTEAIHKSVLQQMWTSSGSVQGAIVMVGAFNKTQASAFAGIATTTYNLNSPKVAAVIGAADVYVSDWGIVSFVPNRLMRTRDAIYVRPAYAKIGYLRPYEVVKLAKTGHAEKRVLRTEWCHIVTNEAAMGGAWDLTTS